MISVFDMVENIVGKGGNAGYQHFLLFPQCLQKFNFSGSLKVRMCGKELRNTEERQPWKTFWEKEKMLYGNRHFESHLFSYLSMLSIWPSLEFCELANVKILWKKEKYLVTRFFFLLPQCLGSLRFLSRTFVKTFDF